MYRRQTFYNELTLALKSAHGLITVLLGPRQIGKTTCAQQVQEEWKGPTHYAAADLPLPPDSVWIQSQWDLARREASTKGRCLLILDEIQKVPRWSEVVKSLCDEDRRKKTPVTPLLLGSSSLLISKGLSESLSGRFQLLRCIHWGFLECKEAFKYTLEDWIYFGGYPGTAKFKKKESLWRAYILDSLIETVISRDVLQMQTITKPTLLRHLFALSATYPAQIFSYNKMLGQLQDAGNTVTLAHYLRLLETAFLVSGLEQYTVGAKRKRGSSPKLVLWNNALVNALSGISFKEAKSDTAWWGRLVENAVGAHLLNHLQDIRYQVTYWRDGTHEVDYVVQSGKNVFAIEVKSSRSGKNSGLALFLKQYPHAKPMLVGTGGMPLEKFFTTHPQELF